MILASTEIETFLFHNFLILRHLDKRIIGIFLKRKSSSLLFNTKIKSFRLQIYV